MFLHISYFGPIWADLYSFIQLNQYHKSVIVNQDEQRKLCIPRPNISKILLQYIAIPTIFLKEFVYTYITRQKIYRNLQHL